MSDPDTFPGIKHSVVTGSTQETATIVPTQDAAIFTNSQGTKVDSSNQYDNDDDDDGDFTQHTQAGLKE